MKKPVHVAVTGAAGTIGYAAIFRIAAGDMLGHDQPVHLQLIEIPPAMKALEGVVMELKDCAFPLLAGTTATSSLEEGFDQTDFALLIGARPRGPGMERADLLGANGAIFAPQGKAIDQRASKDVRVLVVGNPANTNCLIAASQAKRLDRRQFTSMMRLDHNRAMSQLADKTGNSVNDVKRIIVWGNHSAGQFPDIAHATVRGEAAAKLVDQSWYRDTFIPTVQKRGAAVIAQRGASSAASAASAALDHMRTWMTGTAEGDWTSMGVWSDGAGYGVGKDLIYSYPVRCRQGSFEIVRDLPCDEFARKMMTANEDELQGERKLVEGLL